MSDSLQTIVVLALIAAAGGYVARAVYRVMARRKSSCGACPSCPASQEPQVVILGGKGDKA